MKALPEIILILAIPIIILIIVWGLFLLGKKVFKVYQIRSGIDPAIIRNINQEKEFIDDILEDIRKNTDEWFIMSEFGNANLLANDYKNIGITYSNMENATILLNLESLSNFDKSHEDTVKIAICGAHVREFLKTAEALIDKRGNEIAFFKTELEKRL